MLWFETHFECIDLVVLTCLSPFEPPPNHQTALGASQRLLKVTGQILQTSVEVEWNKDSWHHGLQVKLEIKFMSFQNDEWYNVYECLWYMILDRNIQYVCVDIFT